MPESVGHYRIIRQIGRGGMGVVYEAIDERLQRSVALKMILPSADTQMRDRFAREALAKSPAARYQTADDMARDLRACLSRGEIAGSPIVRTTTRLIVLPFRLLRPDPAIDFLAFSLPDAITVSLSGLESLVVRSSLAAAKFHEGPPDLNVLASEINVDAVVTGTLLHAGGQVRISVQLVEAPSGTVRWSHALQAPLDDLFRIQDEISSAVVQALALPLSNREERQLRRDVPASPGAYADYLQANRVSASSSHSMGRSNEAVEICRSAERRAPGNVHLVTVLEALLAIVEERYEKGRGLLSQLLGFPGFSDPEGWYYWAHAAAGLRDGDTALELLGRAVDGGMHCVRGLETTPQLDSLRLDPRFAAIIERARVGQAVAARAFAEAGGHRLLGLPLP